MLAALVLNPDDPETLGQLGGLARRGKAFELAMTYYSRAFDVAPSSAYIKAANAELHLTHGDPELALQWYRELASLSDLEKHQRDPWMQLIGAEALFVLGDDEGANRHYEGALLAGATASQVVSLADQLEYFAQGNFRAKQALQLLRSLQNPSEKTPPEVDEGQAFTILHLSDTHFGTIGEGPALRNMHRFRDGDENSFTLRESLVDDLRRLDEQGQVDLARIVLVVSGDLVYTGKTSEFDLVKEFLEGLCDDLALPREQVVLVPGNHDIDWDESKLDKRRRFDNFLMFARSFYGGVLFGERYPLVHWDFSVDTPRPEPRDLVQVSTFFDTTWIGLNSCVFETHEEHFGFVGERQLRAVQDLVSRRGKSRDPIIVVMHHHLHPYPETLSAPRAGDVWMDLSIIRDSGQVERTIEELGAILLLHGHKHKPQLRRTQLLDKYVSPGDQDKRELIVNGSGSAGVDESELEHDQGNHYSLIRVIPEREIVVNWRELGLHAGARWRTTNRWTLPLGGRVV